MKTKAGIETLTTRSIDSLVLVTRRGVFWSEVKIARFVKPPPPPPDLVKIG